MESYNSKNGAKQYIEFIESTSGQYEQEILLSYILQSLGLDTSQKILDAGCGTGWLSNALAKKYSSVAGADASKELITYAKNKYPGRVFIVCDLVNNLPLEKNSLDAVVANMSLHDMENPKKVLGKLHNMLKPNGKLILTISNPYYSLPVGVWKRGFFGRLFLQKPKLLLRPYYFFKNKPGRKFEWGANIKSNFYTLEEYINWSIGNGFELKNMREIEAKDDNTNFGMQYQLHRFPYILLLEFKKPAL